MWLSLLLQVFAGTPTHCIASWTGPAPSCVVTGAYSADGFGLSPKSAERAARAQLATIVELEIAARKVAVPVLTASDFASCSQALQNAQINCFEDADVGKEDVFCFAMLNEPECWNGQVMNFQEDAWKVWTVARKEMCSAVDAYLVEQNYSGLELRRATCAARCQEKLTVRCP